MKNNFLYKCRILICLSICLSLSIDLLLVISELLSLNRNTYCLHALINIYIMSISLIIDYLAYVIGKNIDINVYSFYINHLVKIWKINRPSKIDSSMIMSDCNKIIIPFIKSCITLIQTLCNLFFCMIAIAILFNKNYILGAICIFFLIIIFISFFLLTIQQEKIQIKLITLYSKFQKTVLEGYLGIRDLIIYQQQNNFLKKNFSVINSVVHLFYKSLILSGFNVCVFSSLDILLPSLIMLILQKANIDSMQYVCIVFYFLFAIKKIGNFISIVQNNSALYKKYKTTDFSRIVSNSNSSGKIDTQRYFSGVIRLEKDNILISEYKSSISNLKIQNQKIIYGEKVILDAPIGSGKSILFKDIFEELGKNNVTYIPPEISLFNGTIYENIFFAEKKTLTTQEKSIIEKVGFNEAILNQRITNNELSGGEKKRIAFLRFYFNKKTVNILDETLTEIEENLLNEMITLIKECKETVLVASHNELVKNHFEKINLLKMEEK